MSMKAVSVAHSGLIHYLSTGELGAMEGISQNHELELRYPRAADFTDKIARIYLDRDTRNDMLSIVWGKRNFTDFVRPYFEN